MLTHYATAEGPVEETTAAEAFFRSEGKMQGRGTEVARYTHGELTAKARGTWESPEMRPAVSSRQRMEDRLAADTR